MKNSLKDCFRGFWSLVTGLRITLRQFFASTVTVQYPHESLKLPTRFRGHIELIRDPETGKALCFACKLCERACPSDCITVEGAKLEGAKKRSVVAYKLDFTKCSLCGSCVEACRDGAIRFSREFNLASTNKDDFVMDLFKRLEAERLVAEQNESHAQIPETVAANHDPGPGAALPRTQVPTPSPKSSGPQATVEPAPISSAASGGSKI
jgi:NADH-quinone oxidoreductase subunit I